MTPCFRKFFYLAALTVFIPFIACSSVRVVSLEPGEGGQVAIHPKDSDTAREKAAGLMRDACGSNKTFKVTKESEEVVGSTTNSQTTAGRTLASRPALNTTSVSRNKTEWRLTYKCVAPPR